MEKELIRKFERIFSLAAQDSGGDYLDLGGGYLLVMRLIPSVHIFNFVHLLHCEADPESFIDRAEAEMIKRGVRPHFKISDACSPSDLSERLRRRGYSVHKGVWDVMELLEKSTVEANPSIELRRARPSDSEEYARALIEGFQIPWERQSAWKHYAETRLRGRSECILAYVADELAGTGFLFSDEGMGGISDVAVLPRFRRKGVATSLCLRLSEMSRDVGNEHTVLEAERGGAGQRIYTRLGFRHVVSCVSLLK